MRMNRSLDSIDPAVSYDTTSIPILRMTNDGLVGFNQASGLAGTQLVPDLAVSLPTPTDAGKTYTFRLRPNIQYSERRTVKASDIRRAFERDFEIGKLPVDYYDVILGADRCGHASPTATFREGSSRTTARHTVTFHLVAPDSDFLDQLALEFAYVVPPGAPPKEMQTPLRATGPYMITSYRLGHGLTLGRNPYFHEWSKAAQPDGYPDSIDLQDRRHPGRGDPRRARRQGGRVQHLAIASPPSAAILKVLIRSAREPGAREPSTGDDRAVPQHAPRAVRPSRRPKSPELRRRPRRRSADQRRPRSCPPDLPDPATALPRLPAVLPVHRPPFDGRRVERANLAKARALVARSGTRGMKITVWSWGDLAGFGPYTTRLLQSLGYRVSMKTVRGNHYFAVAFDSRNTPQIGTAEWITDYPTASGFFSPLFTCASFQPESSNNVNGAEFCDPRLDRKISRAVTEQTTNPDAARRLWAQIDRTTVDAAPWVPLVNPNVVDVLARRVGNYQYSPAGWGMLIDQLWVR